MPISQDLLEILICPACRAKVELKEDASALVCQNCGRSYSIQDDIPSMLIVEECPSCKQTAMMQVEGENLKCPECGHTYPIVPSSKSQVPG
ncbi:MAG: hypothetical protein ICV60_15500 [Pyrinomonadaceae bacterium]|nr:hypothetical protein [Pyrinomonadaceae bacterium]